MPSGESARTVTDDLGFPMGLPESAGRVVSLVPSLTESVAATRPEALVGVTDWCSHPADLEAVRLRGTKNPHVRKIIELAPDVVLANKEENRQLDVQRLRAAGVCVWVTDIERVDQAFVSLRRLFEQALGWPVPDWIHTAEAVWERPPQLRPHRIVIPIWRDPWMVVGSHTFTGDLLARLGLVNLYATHPERYPRLELADIRASGPDLVLLPDEPYKFTGEDGPEAFSGVRCALISGRPLTWYGPSLITAPAVVSEALT